MNELESKIREANFPASLTEIHCVPVLTTATIDILSCVSYTTCSSNIYNYVLIGDYKYVLKDISETWKLLSLIVVNTLSQNKMNFNVSIHVMCLFYTM